MKIKQPKAKKITAAQQWIHINRHYSKVITSYSLKCGELILRIELSPSENSIKYQIEIKFKNNGFPTAYMINPAIEKVDGKPPKHLYKQDKTGRRPLCVFDPKTDEWNGTMLIAETFIPWVLTWLNAYEFWQITGVWEYNESKHIKNNR